MFTNFNCQITICQNFSVFKGYTRVNFQKQIFGNILEAKRATGVELTGFLVPLQRPETINAPKC